MHANELIIFLDPGHGGPDPGALYYYDGKPIKEAELNLKISFSIRENLNKYEGIKVYLSREDNDTYLDLEERVTLAKSFNAACIISIHNNASTSFSANGAEVMISSGNDGSNHTLEASKLGNKILDELQVLGLYRRGLVKRISETYYYPNGKLADYYGIIRHSVNQSLLGIIVESAFLSNEADYRTYLSNDEILWTIGESIAKGIASYYNLNLKTEKDLVSFLGDLDRDTFITTHDAYCLYRLIEDGQEINMDISDVNSDNIINEDDLIGLLDYTIGNINSFSDKESLAIRKPDKLTKGRINTQEDDPYLNVRKGPSVSAESIGAYDRNSIIYILRDEDKAWAYVRGICAYSGLIIEGYSSMAYIDVLEEDQMWSSFSLEEDLVLQGPEGLASLELIIECEGASIESDNIFVKKEINGKIYIHMINSSNKQKVLKFVVKEGENFVINVNIDNVYDQGGVSYRGYDLSTSYSIEESQLLFKGPYVTGIRKETKLGDFLKSNPDIDEIYNVNGSIPSDDDYVKTGMKIIIASQEYWIYIKGDVNGDGKADQEDIKRLQKHLLDESLLAYSYFMAGDMDASSLVNSIDLAYLQKYIYESSP